MCKAVYVLGGPVRLLITGGLLDGELGQHSVELITYFVDHIIVCRLFVC